MSRTDKSLLIRIQPAERVVNIAVYALLIAVATLSGNWPAAILAVLAGMWAWIAFDSQKNVQALLKLLDETLDELKQERAVSAIHITPATNLREDIETVKRTILGGAL